MSSTTNFLQQYQPTGPVISRRLKLPVYNRESYETALKTLGFAVDQFQKAPLITSQSFDLVKQIDSANKDLSDVLNGLGLNWQFSPEDQKCCWNLRMQAQRILAQNYIVK